MTEPKISTKALLQALRECSEAGGLCAEVAEETLRRARELSASRQPAPSGKGDVVSVPRWATDEMMEAAVEAMNKVLPDINGKPGFRMFRAGWEAALAASGQTEGEGR